MNTEILGVALQILLLLVISYPLGKHIAKVYKVFLDTFAAEIGNDLRKVELIEALLFLSMIPLHGESIRHQMVMLGTGLEILNRVVNIQVEGEE